MKNKKAFNFFDISLSRKIGWVEGENIFSYKYMFLKINHLFVYFLAWNFFHGKNFLHPKTERNERKKRKGEGSNKRSTWGGESRVSSVYREPWNMMFLQSMVAFLRISGVHTRNITFRKLCLPIDMAGTASSSPLTAGASVRVCVQIFHTHAPSVQLEIYQALPSSISFAFVPNCLFLCVCLTPRFFAFFAF